jgi:hypothetical protein
VLEQAQVVAKTKTLSHVSSRFILLPYTFR